MYRVSFFAFWDGSKIDAAPFIRDCVSGAALQAVVRSKEWHGGPLRYDALKEAGLTSAIHARNRYCCPVTRQLDLRGGITEDRLN